MTMMLDFISPMSCFMMRSIPIHGKHSNALDMLNSKTPRVVGRILPPPQDVHALTPGICECYRMRPKDFADVIKVYRL